MSSAYRRGFFSIAPILVLVFLPAITQAQALAVSREALESFAKYLTKGGAKAAPGTIRATEKLITSHGDDALRAANSVGWKVVGDAAESAGERAPELVKYMARKGKESIHVVATPRSTAIFLKYGDEAGDAMIRHKGLAADLIEEGGQPMAKALSGIGTREARQMAMLADDASTASLARDPKVLEMVSSYGDRAMRFMWENKGALLVGTTLATFAANPEAFLDGSVQLGQTAINTLGGKTIEKGGEVLQETARVFPWNTALLLGAGLSLPIIFFRMIRANKA